MNEAACYFMEGVRVGLWFAMEHPLPHDLHLAAQQELRSIVYALLHALDFMPDEPTPLIGRLAEIDRRIVRTSACGHPTARPLPAIWAKRSGSRGDGPGP
jgi:hypothetical protein